MDGVRSIRNFSARQQIAIVRPCWRARETIANIFRENHKGDWKSVLTINK